MNSQYLQKKKFPDSPGVYFFLGPSKKILYIGKATSLKDRVKSYFDKDIRTTRSEWIEKMVGEAKTLDFKPTESVLEALLLEADLIKKFRPLYNTREKDDKSFNCVVLTDEDFPRLQVIRKKEINFENCTARETRLRSVFGPYTQGMALKEALKIIRKILPYRDDKCELYADQIKKHDKAKPCFNRQIGLCPGTCTGEISKRDYQKQIKYLELFLSGNIKKLEKSLTAEMNAAAKEEKFEEARLLRNKIYSLNHIQDIALIKKDVDGMEANPSEKLFRIESFDIAHLKGDAALGVMVVSKNDIIDKNSYRKFNIKTAIKGDDVGALRETLNRRLNHPEWPYPDVFVIDGGQNQLNALNNILKERNIPGAAVSVVKDEHHKAREILGDQEIAAKHKNQILSINAEAHRFAITHHRKKVRKNFLM